MCIVISCDCFWPRHSPYSYYKFRTSDIVAVGNQFNVFSYEAVLADNRNHNFSDAEQMRYVLRYRRGLKLKLFSMVTNVAFRFLDYAVAGTVPKPGKTSLVHMLTPKGKVYAELTITCRNDHRYTYHFIPKHI